MALNTIVPRRYRKQFNLAIVITALIVLGSLTHVLPFAITQGELDYLSVSKLTVNNQPEWIIYARTTSSAPETLRLSTQSDTSTSASTLYADITKQQCLWDVIVDNINIKSGDVHAVYNWQAQQIASGHIYCDYTDSDCITMCTTYVTSKVDNIQKYLVYGRKHCSFPGVAECYCAWGLHAATIGDELEIPKSYTEVNTRVIQASGTQSTNVVVSTNRPVANTEYGVVELVGVEPREQGSCLQENYNVMLPAKGAAGDSVKFWYTVSKAEFAKYSTLATSFSGYISQCADPISSNGRNALYQQGVITDRGRTDPEICLQDLTNKLNSLSTPLINGYTFKSVIGGENFGFFNVSENKGSLGFNVAVLRSDAELKYTVNGNIWLSLDRSVGKPTLTCPTTQVAVAAGGRGDLTVQLSSTGDGVYTVSSECDNAQSIAPVGPISVKSGQSTPVTLGILADNTESSADISCKVYASGYGGQTSCDYTIDFSNWAACGQQWLCAGNILKKCDITGNYQTVETCDEGYECRIDGSSGACVKKSIVPPEPTCATAGLMGTFAQMFGFGCDNIGLILTAIVLVIITAIILVILGLIIKILR